MWLLPSPLPIPSANCLSFSVLLCVIHRACWRERRGRGWGRSQILRRQESPGPLQIVQYFPANPRFLCGGVYCTYRGSWRSGGYPCFFNFKEWFHSPIRTVREIYIERKQINNGLERGRMELFGKYVTSLNGKFYTWKTCHVSTTCSFLV